MTNILGIIIPIDFHIFQRGGPTTSQIWISIVISSLKIRPKLDSKPDSSPRELDLRTMSLFATFHAYFVFPLYRKTDLDSVLEGFIDMFRLEMLSDFDLAELHLGDWGKGRRVVHSCTCSGANMISIDIQS